MRFDPDSPRHSLIAVALCAFAYLYVFPYQPRINNPNENVRLYMTAAIVEEGRYEIDTLRARWGWVNDAAKLNGHIYSVKAPATSLLGVPGYAAYRAFVRAAGLPFERTQALWVCRFTATILPMLLWLYFFHRWLVARRYPPALRDAAFFSIALGSLLYGYGMLFVSHALSAATAFGAFALLADARASEQPVASWRALLAGLFAAGTTALEYPGLPCSLVLTAYALIVLWPRGGLRALGAFAIGGALPTAAVMHFQWRAFGSPFTPGHLYVETAALREAHHQGLYGAVGVSWEALHGLLFDLGAGLFPLTPLLCASAIGFGLLLRERERRADGVCALLVCLITVLVIASMNNWRGGWTIGPRYLALAVPFFAWAALHGLAWLSRRWRVSALAFAIGATAAALLASGAPSAYYPHLPPEITRPLPQVIAVLWARDLAPYTLAAAAGVYGTASMLPLVAAALAVLALCVRAVPAARERLTAGAGALLVAALLVWPLLVRPADEQGVAKAVAFITKRWSPQDHHHAAP